MIRPSFLVLALSLLLYHLSPSLGISRVTWINQLLFFLIPGLLGIVFLLKKGQRPQCSLKASTRDYLVAIVITAIGALALNWLAHIWQEFIPLPSRQIGRFQGIQNLLPNNPLTFFITLCVIPAVCEEVLFRGFVQSSLRGCLTPNQAMAICALIFGLAHTTTGQAPFYVALGLWFGFLMEWRRNLIFPILAHITTNLVALILLRYL
jgi:membrane protease YdiL (CAAX protease family)